MIFKRADYAQKIKFSIKDFFSKCDQIRRLIFLCSVNAYDNCRTLLIENKKIVWKHGLNWLFKVLMFKTTLEPIPLKHESKFQQTKEKDS